MFLFFFKKRTGLSPDPHPSLPLLHNLLIQNVLSRQPTGWTRSKPAPGGSTVLPAAPPLPGEGGKQDGGGGGVGRGFHRWLSAPQFKVVSPTSCHVSLTEAGEVWPNHI